MSFTGDYIVKNEASIGSKIFCCGNAKLEKTVC
jgi:hypothetical protein